MSSCTLCGLPAGDRSVRDDDVDGEFCCRGCLEVYRTVDDGSEPENEGGPDFDGDLEADAPPVDVREDREDSGTLDDRDDLETAFLSLEGMHCTACERFLEATATETEGVEGARASYATEMIRLRYDPDEIDRRALADAVSGYGYRASDPGDSSEGEGVRAVLGRYRAVLAALLAMPVMAPYLLFIYPTYLGLYPESFLYGATIRTMVFVPLVVWSTLIVLGLGYPIFRSAAVSLRVGRPNVDVLISIAVLAAYAYSAAAFAVGSRHLYFDVAVMVLVIVTVGNRVESRVKRRAIDAHADLAAARETSVRRLADDGSLEETDPDACDPGDRVLVREGERIPFDGTILEIEGEGESEGAATIDEALITGESIPRSASTGDAVVGGSILADGSIVVEIGNEASSTLDRLVELVWDVQSADAGAQRLVNTFAVLFVPLVVLVAAAAAAFWLAAGRPPSTALLIGLSVLVVSCPCSLGIATPLALAAGSGRAADERAVVLSPAVLERITDSDIVVFDKTGTLTTGEMTVADVVAAEVEDGGEDESVTEAERIVERAAAVETRSNHPIAEAVVDAAVDAADGTGPQPDPSARTVDAFEREDRAVSATVDGSRVRVGHPTAFDAEAWTIPDRIADGVEAIRDRGARPVAVGWDGLVRGVLEIRDEPREDWDEIVAALAADGRRIVVLTGDDERATRWLDDHPDVDEIFAGVRPESKEAIVRRLRREGTTTMIGDGTNDAPALARADMGLALESGTDVALDAADVAVLDDDLASIPTVFEISRATRRRIRQNLGWAVGYNLVAIPLAAAGYINPLVAALLMGGSSLLVVINSGRGAFSERDSSGAFADDSRRSGEFERDVTARGADD